MTTTPAEAADPPYEKFTWLGIEYDITKALELTAGRVDGEIEVASWARTVFAAEDPQELLDPLRGISILCSHVDTAYALGHKPEWGEPDLDKPLLIVTETGPKGPFGKIIDGHHRLYRAWHDGLAKLPACAVTDEERAQIRTNRVDPHDN